MAAIPIDKLLDKIHSIYKLVIISSRRAIELPDGAQKLVDEPVDAKPAHVALDEILAGKTDPLLKEALAAYAKANAAQAAPKPAAVITKANGAVSAPKPKAKPLTAQQVQVAEMMVRAKQIELLKARLAALKAEVRDTTNALTDEQKQAILDRNQAKDKPILK